MVKLAKVVDDNQCTMDAQDICDEVIKENDSPIIERYLLLN